MSVHRVDHYTTRGTSLVMTLPASTITGILYVLTVPHLTCSRIAYNEDKNNPSSEGVNWPRG